MLAFNSNGVYFNAEHKGILRILRIRNKFKDGPFRWLEDKRLPVYPPVCMRRAHDVAF